MQHKKPTSEPSLHVAVIESDPLRLAGFRHLLGCYDDLHLIPASLSDIGALPGINVVLLWKRPNQNLVQTMQQLRMILPDVRVIVTMSGCDDETILEALAAGAKGCVDETAPAADFANAIRIVNQGMIWASRRVVAIYIERSLAQQSNALLQRKHFTSRETEVLKMLVAGCSNKEIASPLGIQERTVKAHVAKLLRKVGVQNRIMLSMHVISHSLVRLP